MNYARFRPHVIATLALGMPLVGSHLARMAIGVSDTVMMGWYGVEELAALVIATSLFFILFMLGSGYGIGVMGLIATALARGDETEIRRATRMALWLSSLHVVLVTPLMWWSEPILLALGQTPLTAALSQDYLRIACWGMLPALWALVLNSYLAAMERTQVVLWITLAGLPLNILLNWIFIFGNLGAPELGVRGAAIASISVQFSGVALILAYALWLPMARRFALMVRFWRPDWHAFRAIFRLGMPVGLTLVAEVGMFVSSNIMMGWIGTQELAAHGIALQITSIVFMVHLGLSNAATVRVGQAKGRHDQKGMADAAITVIAISLVIAVLTIFVYVLIPDKLVMLYLDPLLPTTPIIVAIASMLMFYAALFQLTDSIQVIALGLLRGVQDTRVPMIYAAISYWLIGVPVAYVLAFTMDVGPAGLWLGLVAGLSTAAVLLLVRFYRGLWRGVWTATQGAG